MELVKKCAIIYFLVVCLVCCKNTNQEQTSVKPKIVEIKIHVFDGVGGSNIREENSKLTVFNAGTDQSVFKGVISHGYISLTLESGKAYDFELEGYNEDSKKEKLAGSKILNYYISEAPQQSLTMLQFSLGMITKGITPPVVSVKDKTTGKEITDDFEINDDVKTLSVEFSSTVGGVEPVSLAGFGAKIAFGSTPNFSNGITGNFFEPIYKDGIFVSNWEFNIDKGKVPKGKTELIIVGYDVANNRVEKHIRIKYAKTSDILSFGNNIYFKGLAMYVDRYPYYMGLFNAKNDDVKIKELLPASPRDGNYTSGVSFALKKTGLITDVNVPIVGFDILRKQGLEWKKVASKLYANDSPEIHQGFDGDSSLEEGEDYEYKVIAFGETDKVESPIMKAKLLPSFTYSLHEPENFKRISLQEAYNLSFSCKISKPDLVLNKEVADYINAGLIIIDNQKNPNFGAKFRYYFDDGNGQPDVRISLCGAQNIIETKSINDMIKSGSLSMYGITNLKDLVEISKDTLIIKPKFLKIPQFNILPLNNSMYHGINRPITYNYGYVYEWDIQAEWRNPLRLDDDEALHLVKILKFENTDKSNGHVYCRSFGNNKSHGANSINGRFTFSITKE